MTRPVLLKLWSMDQHHQHRLGAYYTCKFMGHVQDQVNQDLWGVGPRNPQQALLGIPTPKSENHWVRQLSWDGRW